MSAVWKCNCKSRLASSLLSIWCLCDGASVFINKKKKIIDYKYGLINHEPQVSHSLSGYKRWYICWTYWFYLSFGRNDNGLLSTVWWQNKRLRQTNKYQYSLKEKEIICTFCTPEPNPFLVHYQSSERRYHNLLEASFTAELNLAGCSSNGYLRWLPLCHQIATTCPQGPHQPLRYQQMVRDGQE